MSNAGRPVTTKPKTGPSYRLAEWLNVNLERRLSITQTELAARLGYKQNMISMMKTGKARIPLDKVEALAIELGVDPSALIMMALEQYLPGQDIMRLFGRVVSKSQLEFLKRFEDLIPLDGATYSDEQVEAVRRILSGET